MHIWGEMSVYISWTRLFSENKLTKSAGLINSHFYLLFFYVTSLMWILICNSIHRVCDYTLQFFYSQQCINKPNTVNTAKLCSECHWFFFECHKLLISKQRCIIFFCNIILYRPMCSAFLFIIVSTFSACKPCKRNKRFYKLVVLFLFFPHKFKIKTNNNTNININFLFI